MADSEEALRASDEACRLALEAAGHAYFELDVGSGRVVAGAPCATLGYAAGEIPPLLEAWLPLVHPDDRRAVTDAAGAQREGRVDAQRIECRARARDGSWRCLLVAARVLSRDADRAPLRVVGTVTDVTEVRALRERLLVADRLASLGALAAGIAHAVNNPLSSVTSTLRVLAEELDRLVPEPQRLPGVLGDLRQQASDALQGSERVREVVRALQLFAAPQTPRPREPVDVRRELHAALELTRSTVAQRARLAVEIAPSLPPVAAVPGELGQAFLSLLVEAAAAVPEGHAADHEVRLVARAAPDGVVVEVHDTGATIAPEHLPRVFQPFFSARPRPAGGLALSLCHGVVSATGGAIAVESAPECGTTFRVTLPAAAPVPGAAPPPPAARRGRVLVLDDDPLVGRSMARLLQGAHEVTVLTSSLDAVARIERGERWDAVLCDLMMPELSGMELEERLARAAPDLLPRVVYLTGGAFTDRAREFLGGGRPWLEKPVDAHVLRTRVAELVRRATADALH